VLSLIFSGRLESVGQSDTHSKRGSGLLYYLFTIYLVFFSHREQNHRKVRGSFFVDETRLVLSCLVLQLFFVASTHDFKYVGGARCEIQTLVHVTLVYGSAVVRKFVCCNGSIMNGEWCFSWKVILSVLKIVCLIHRFIVTKRSLSF
jgi:hypothetical protein